MHISQVVDKTKPNKGSHDFISIKLEGEIFSNYIAIIYNKKFLLMPTPFTKVSPSQWNLLSMCKEYFSENKEPKPIDGSLQDIKKINTKENNTYMSFPTTNIHIKNQIYIFSDKITDNKKKKTLKEMSCYFYIFSVMSILLFHSAYIQKDTSSYSGSIIVGIVSAEFALICLTLFDLLKNETRKQQELLQEDTDIFYEYKDTMHVGKDNCIVSKICFFNQEDPFYDEVPTNILWDQDYKIILPRSVEKRYSLKYGAENAMSITVSVSCGNKIISQFINTNIEFNDRINCPWLSLGSSIGCTIHNGSINYLFSNESFPLVRAPIKTAHISRNPDVLLNHLPPTVENSAEQIFKEDHMDEIAKAELIM